MRPIYQFYFQLSAFVNAWLCALFVAICSVCVASCTAINQNANQYNANNPTLAQNGTVYASHTLSEAQKYFNKAANDLSPRDRIVANWVHWHVSGVVAIRGPQNSVSAQMDWQQSKDKYAISLYAPLGASSFSLYGSPQSVVLMTSKGQRFYASNAETLLAQQLGFNFPVSSLYFWLRGLPSPFSTAKKYFDRYQRIAALNQDGWTIQYLEYTRVNYVDLPAKIYLANSQFSIKVVIRQWQIS